MTTFDWGQLLGARVMAQGAATPAPLAPPMTLPGH